jgi:hypothetical protein
MSVTWDSGWYAPPQDDNNGLLSTPKPQLHFLILQASVTSASTAGPDSHTFSMIALDFRSREKTRRAQVQLRQAIPQVNTQKAAAV